MNIISNNYINLLKEMIISKFSENVKSALNKTNDNPTVFNYITLLSSLDNSLSNIAKESLITIFEAIDNGFKDSKERKTHYHIKAYHKSSLMTIFGEITFKRTFYSYKDNKGSFCYLDSFLCLNKYDYFDPYIKSLVIDYSTKYSFQKTGYLISEMIGNRIELSKECLLSRQIVRNIIIKSTMPIPKYEQIDNVETLYVMADEKFIHTQRNNNFNSFLPRWNVVTKLNPSSQVLFSSFSKQTKNKIRKSYRRGISIYKGTKNELKLFYSFLDKSISERIEYYISYYDIFKEKDMIELYFAKLNPSTFIQTSNKLFENKHKRNAHLTNLVQENTKSKAVNRYISLKMNSDKLLNNYKQDIISANSIFSSYPNGVIVAASLIIKYNNEIFFLAEGYNKEFKRFCANHLMKWVIINEYAKKGYSIANHNGISGDFKSNKPYYGLYKYKIGFNGDIYEYIGEFNLVINKYLYFFINKFKFFEKIKK